MSTTALPHWAKYVPQPRLTKYIPHRPWPKQAVFLGPIMDRYREALYGGAAGGGKSDALLMAALQHVDLAGYAAVIFRKTLREHFLPEGLGTRAQEWLANSDARWNGNENCWHFPSGAMLQLGYIGSDVRIGTVKYRYQGTAFQLIAWDELTQHSEQDYRWMFSRLRRRGCEKHQGKNASCDLCRVARIQRQIPLRVRSATNPGGVGHVWVRRRFQIYKDPVLGGFRGRNPIAPFVPALVRDNPALDYAAYVNSLSFLDPVTRAQYLAGDWSVTQQGRFREAWLRRYRLIQLGSYEPVAFVLLTAAGEPQGDHVPFQRCRWFCTVDPAASEREGPGDADIWVNREPSWTAISTWAVTPQADLLLVDCLRFQKEIPDITTALQGVQRQWRPEFMGIESNGPGKGVYQYAQRIGLPVRDLTYLGHATHSKMIKSTDAQNRMASGKIYVPESAPWLDDFLEELLTWTGHPHMVSDQIDTLSYAAMIVSREAGAGELGWFTRDMIPSVH